MSKIEINDNLLSEVTFEHLSESEKKTLVDAGFLKAQVLIDSSDREVRRQAAVELVKSYLKKPKPRN